MFVIDGVIMPWESSMFGFYQTNSSSTIIPMDQQDVYVYDTFGLQTLDLRGGVIVEEEPNVPHNEWLTDETLFVNDILPWLT
jgi:palmitoyl-protein thioesterase